MTEGKAIANGLNICLAMKSLSSANRFRESIKNKGLVDGEEVGIEFAIFRCQ